MGCPQIERNLQDAMCVARNVCKDPRLVPGGGAAEMAVSRALSQRAANVEGVEAGPYRAVGTALEVIPRTLAQNCGANVIRTLTKLRAQHAGEAGCTFGIDGNSGGWPLWMVAGAGDLLSCVMLGCEQAPCRALLPGGCQHMWEPWHVCCVAQHAYGSG